jgi:hypothetical protein
MPMVEVMKPFNRHARGDMVHPPEVIEVSETRAVELKRLGLARDPLPMAKTAPAPQNQMAPPAANKMAPAPENKATAGAEPKRRGRPPGRRNAG